MLFYHTNPRGSSALFCRSEECKENFAKPLDKFTWQCYIMTIFWGVLALILCIALDKKFEALFYF